jgi:hypothetical protein
MTTLSIRKEYETLGVDTYYSDNADSYHNPHAVFALTCLDALWNQEFKSVLDFACGDGLVSKHLKNKYPDILVSGCDKFLHERYLHETGNLTFSYSFEDVANGLAQLPSVDVIVFSYAIDLVEKSYLNTMLYYLSTISKNLIVIRPNSHIVEHFSWKAKQQVKCEKAKAVLYTAVN